MPNLRSGGAERMMVNICNYLVKSGQFSVVLILMNGNEIFFQKELSSKIQVEFLGFSSVKDLIFKPLKLINLLQKFKPGTILTGYGELNAIVILYSFFFKKINFIARETSIPSKRIKNIIIKILYFFFYKYYKYIIVQSNAMAKDLHDNFNVPKSKIIQIYNPLDETSFLSSSVNNHNLIDNNSVKFIFLGTLDRQKNVDKIIKFFDKICSKKSNCSLFIIGNGPEDESIKKLIQKSINRDKIIRENFTNRPFDYLKIADFLIIASEYEGYPNIGIEANYFGVPIILSKNTVGGASELIKAGFNGEIIDFENPDYLFLNKQYNHDGITDFIKQRHSSILAYNSILNLILSNR